MKCPSPPKLGPRRSSVAFVQNYVLNLLQLSCLGMRTFIGRHGCGCSRNSRIGCLLIMDNLHSTEYPIGFKLLQKLYPTCAAILLNKHRISSSNEFYIRCPYILVAETMFLPFKTVIECAWIFRNEVQTAGFTNAEFCEINR